MIKPALWAFSIVFALGQLFTARAHAEEINLTTLTVDGTDYAVCAVEDCSDQGGTGLWLDTDTGNWYLEIGDKTWLVVDDTAGFN